MEEDKIIQIVKLLLNKYGLKSFETLRTQNQKELIEIEKYFQKCDKIYEKVEFELNNQIDLNIRGICKGSGVAKSTVYKEDNKPILKEYIDNRLGDISLKSNACLINKMKVNSMDRYIKELEHDIKLMVIDNIELLELKRKNNELSEKLDNMTRNYNNLLEERAINVKKYNEIDAELKKFRNKQQISNING